MQSGKRCRRYLVRGRLRLAFESYERRPALTGPHDDAESEFHPLSIFGSQHGRTPADAWQAEQLLARAQCERGQLRGPRLAARIAGIVSSLTNGRTANSAWGWSMHGKRGGLAVARHGLYKLRAISPKGARASVIARERQKAQEVFEQDRARRGPVVPPMQRPTSFLES